MPFPRFTWFALALTCLLSFPAIAEPQKQLVCGGNRLSPAFEESFEAALMKVWLSIAGPSRHAQCKHLFAPVESCAGWDIFTTRHNWHVATFENELARLKPELRGVRFPSLFFARDIRPVYNRLEESSSGRGTFATIALAMRTWVTRKICRGEDPNGE